MGGTKMYFYFAKANDNDDKISETSQIYEYNSDELNELSLDKAIKFDKRSFCAYYGNILMFSHISLPQWYNLRIPQTRNF